jgi:CRP/FNR family nitrogen fixation transcriptional regulator
MEVLRMLSQTTLPMPIVSNLAKDPEIQGLLTQTQPAVASFYPVDAMIYAQGDKAGPLYLVEFGTVRVCQLTPDGRRQITSFCYAGDVFGLEPGTEHEFYAESVDGAGVRVLRPANAAGFAQRVLSLALRRFARMQAHLVLLGRLSANEKMARFLCDLMDQQDSDEIINLPMQRADIADYLGLTFETVSRVLRVLKDRGMIRVATVDRIEVLDPQGIRNLSD